jgi:hypothetical protein
VARGAYQEPVGQSARGKGRVARAIGYHRRDAVEPWPPCGDLLRYAACEARLESSQPGFHRFLSHLAPRIRLASPLRQNLALHALLEAQAPKRAARFHSEWAQGAEGSDAASAFRPLPARQAAPSPRLRRGAAIRCYSVAFNPLAWRQFARMPHRAFQALQAAFDAIAQEIDAAPKTSDSAPRESLLAASSPSSAPASPLPRAPRSHAPLLPGGASRSSPPHLLGGARGDGLDASTDISTDTSDAASLPGGRGAGDACHSEAPGFTVLALPLLYPRTQLSRTNEES